jgi:hypothetical protein
VSPELERQLERGGVDLDRLRRCVAAYCRGRPRLDAVEEAGAGEDGG